MAVALVDVDVLIQRVEESVQLDTPVCTIFEESITSVPSVAAVYHPLNVYPSFVALGIVPAVVFVLPV